MIIQNQPTRLCVAIIGDLVNSRALKDRRGEAQQHLNHLLEQINGEYSKAILSRFLITIGDEFQGLLNQADVLPDIIWQIETEFVPQFTNVRFGIGLGTIQTDLHLNALGMDGPAWWAARTAIEEAHKKHHLGGMFHGFGINNDITASGLAFILQWHRNKLTEGQRKAFRYLHTGKNQMETAKLMKMKKQQISQFVRFGGWEPYRAGEEALRTLLSQYNFSQQWKEGG